MLPRVQAFMEGSIMPTADILIEGSMKDIGENRCGKIEEEPRRDH